MKVVGVISSPKRQGNTATLVREVLQGAAAEGAAVTEIFLPDYKIEYCKGCFQCMAEGNCPLANDDFGKLRDFIYEADGIVWGSPTYGATLNARMKAFWERFGMFEYFTSSLGGKYQIGLAVSNGTAEKKTARQLTLLSRGSFRRGYVSGILAAGLRGGKKAADEAALLGRARRLGAKMARDIQRHHSYPFQHILSRLMNRMVLRPLLAKAVKANKDGATKSIYWNLRERELI